MLENDHTNVVIKQTVAESFTLLFVRMNEIKEITVISSIMLAVLSIKEIKYNGHSTAQVEITV